MPRCFNPVCLPYPGNGKPVEFLPWLPYIATAVTSSTPGDFAWLNGVTPGPDNWFICVPRDELLLMFGRRRAWQLSALVTGQMRKEGEVDPVPYAFGFSETQVVLTDITEEMLPHGHFGSYSLLDFDGNVVVTGGMDYQRGAISTDYRKAATPTAATAILPTSPMAYYYFPEEDVYYIRPTFGIGWNYTISGGGDTPRGSLIIIPDGITVPDYTFAGNVSFPTGSLPCYFSATNSGIEFEGADPGELWITLESFTAGYDAPEENGFYEYRDAAGDNPCYDKDTGVRLITPLPKLLE